MINEDINLSVYDLLQQTKKLVNEWYELNKWILIP